MKNLKQDFISLEKREYKWKLGTAIASSLSGFIVGIIITVIIFLSFFDLAWKGDYFVF